MDQPMPAPQGAQPEVQQQPEMGPATKLVVGIHQDMQKLSSMIEGNEDIAPEIKEEFQGLIGAYESLVQKAMNPEAEKPEPAAKGVAPMEAGTADVKPAL